jgi:hypothetical protein
LHQLDRGRRADRKTGKRRAASWIELPCSIGLGVLKIRRLDPAAPAALLEIEIASVRGMARPA